MGSRLVGLHMTALSQRSHMLSRGISLPWEGQSLPGQQSPKISKHHTTQMIFFNVSNILSGYSPWEKKVQVGPEQIKDTAQRKGPGFQTTPIGVRFQHEK